MVSVALLPALPTVHAWGLAGNVCSTVAVYGGRPSVRPSADHGLCWQLQSRYEGGSLPLLNWNVAMASQARADLPRTSCWLPRTHAPIVPRDLEVSRIVRPLEHPDTSLLTLGAPGAGKTTLALIAAGVVSTAFRDGVFFADLTHGHSRPIPGRSGRSRVNRDRRRQR
jgi:hypothetical protein